MTNTNVVWFILNIITVSIQRILTYVCYYHEIMSNINYHHSTVNQRYHINNAPCISECLLFESNVHIDIFSSLQLEITTQITTRTRS